MTARKILSFFRRRGKNVRRAVIAGAGDLGTNLIRELETIPWAGIEIMGFFDDKITVEPDLTVMGKPVLGDISKLPEYLTINDIDYVYIALKGKGRIIIADAPQSDADFDKIREIAGLDEIQSFYKQHVDFNIDEERAGADLIIKQADNPVNLQWLVAYSRSYSKVLKGDFFARNTWFISLLNAISEKLSVT